MKRKRLKAPRQGNPDGRSEPLVTLGPEGIRSLPRGALGPDRLHFYGHSLGLLRDSGIRWARIHFDWSITVGRNDGTRGRIPVVVLCARDRMGAKKYIRAVALGVPTDGININLDQYDKELSKAVFQWKAQ